jgi:hypothetical protein
VLAGKAAEKTVWSPIAMAYLKLRIFEKFRGGQGSLAQGTPRMSRSCVLLHCPNAKLKAATVDAWEGKDLGGIRVLLSNTGGNPSSSNFWSSRA